MSFDKHYPNRKDRRKPYRRRGKYDASCRPHGGCPWCERDRLHRHERHAPADEADQFRDAAEPQEVERGK